MVLWPTKDCRFATRRCQRQGLSAIALLCSLFPAVAPAQSPSRTSPVHVSVASASECIEAGAFSVALAQVAPIRPALEEEAAPKVRLEVRRTEGHFVGTLVMESDGVASVERSVAGADCSEVADALRLMAALALGYEPPTQPATLSPLPRAATAAQPWAAASRPVTGENHRPKYRAWLEGLVGWAYLGAGPGGWGVEIAGELSSIRKAGPAFRLSVSGMRKQAVHPPGQAEFTWITARPQACPMPFRIGALGAQPCVGIEAGLIQAAGQRVEASRTAYRAWVGPMLSGRLHWSLSDRLRLSVQAACIAPLVRDEFAFEPGAVVYRAPAAVFLTQGGLAWRFP